MGAPDQGRLRGENRRRELRREEYSLGVVDGIEGEEEKGAYDIGREEERDGIGIRWDQG